MIDSHCHLDFDPLFSNIDQIIDRSKEIGVEKILTICTTKNSFDKILKIINYDPIIYGTYGIHPHEVKNNSFDKSEIVKNVQNNDKIIGVGETGLDFYYENSAKQIQLSSFVNHIESSIELNVPVIVHSRNAENDTFNILNEYKNSNIKILMHCFTGSLEFAKKLMNLNTFFSASGIITFKNSIDLQDTFKHIDMKKVLIETDSPFLSPVPMRGKENEPSYIKYTLEKLSEIYNISSIKLDKITTSNFNKLFFSNVD